MQLQRTHAQSNRQLRRRIAKQSRKHGSRPSGRSENVGAMVQVAEGLRLSGRYEEAENLWRQLLVDFPDQPQPYVGLAALLSLLDRHPEAYDLYKKAATIAPHEFVVWRQFALCLTSLRQYEAATIAYRKAIALNPCNAELHLDLARSLFYSGRPDEALLEYDAAITLKPDHVMAHLGKGIQLQTLGRVEAAKAAFLHAIDLDPKCTVAHFRLASMEQSPEEADRALARLEELTELAGLSDPDKASIHFAAATLLHNQKQYDRAFERYAAANATIRKDNTFDRDAFKDRIDQTIEGYAPDVFDTHQKAASASDSPIFIVGMPRSGTTLVETIISSHPLVAAGGEERKLAEIADALGHTGGALTYPLDIARINPSHLLPLGTQYLSHMARLHAGARKVTDKLPFNCLHLGLIALLFPKATIIHCTRDPIDTCLSCYFQYFGEAKLLSFTNDLADLGFLYTQYRRLMKHWHDVLPVRVLDIRYEDLIASQEEVSRQLIAAAGLEWDEACLRFHTLERSVNTASHSQVRQPIYNSSVEKWRHYERHLGPLAEALGQTP